MKAARNPRIDCLRAISMLLIVVQHYVFWGLKPLNLDVFQIIGSGGALLNYLSMETLYLLSCIGVNCFVMISGYFTITKTTHRWDSLLRLWFTTVFYSVILFLVSLFLSKGQLTLSTDDLKALLHCFFPVYSRQYWFISTYIAVMLIAPYFSIMVKNITRKNFRYLLVILFCLTFMFPYGQQFAGGMSVLWMLFVYLVGGYIRLYGIDSKISNNIVLIFFGIIFILVLGFLAYDIAQNHGISNFSFRLHGFASDSPIFFLSLSCFIWAIRKEESQVSSISKLWIRLSPYVLAVYLIHMNKYFYPFIWKIFIPETNSIPIALHALMCSLIIFFVCIIIDLLRSMLFRVSVDRLIEIIKSKINIYYEK